MRTAGELLHGFRHVALDRLGGEDSRELVLERFEALLEVAAGHEVDVEL